MTEKNDPTQCITCLSTLPPDISLAYFSQESTAPKPDDTGYCEEVRRMLAHLLALLQTIAFGGNAQWDDKLNSELAELGVEVAEEALRRIHLVQEAENLRWIRCEDLRKRLGEVAETR